MSSPTPSLHPVVVVTGANSGVGFGICHRLLLQLSRQSPSDALLRTPSKERPISRSLPSPFAPAKQLTLVLACRSAERAATARQRLLQLINHEVSRQKRTTGYDGHAEYFLQGLRIEHIKLDLSNMDTVFEFAEEANRRYPYITHLILNAGLLPITAFNWPMVARQLLTEPVAAVTTPRFLTQRVGAESLDGLGLVWQSNLFAHYSLSRLLEPLLLRNPYADSRVEFVSSLDALPEDYNSSDPQLLDAVFPYQASKFQIDLVCMTLARTAAQKPTTAGETRIRYLLVQPGVCSTNMTVSVMGVFLELLKHIVFYMARILGSQNHAIRPHKGAVSAVHAALAPPALLGDLCRDPPKKYGSRANLWGNEYVGLDPILDWEAYIDEGATLVRLCERIFSAFAQKRRDSPSPTTTDGGIALN